MSLRNRMIKYKRTEIAKQNLELSSEGMFRNFIDIFRSEESKIENRLKSLKLVNSCKTIITPKALEEYINLLKMLFSTKDLRLDKLKNIKTDNLNKLLDYKPNVKTYFKKDQWEDDAIDIIAKDGKYWNFVNDYSYEEDGYTYNYSDRVDKIDDEVQSVDIYKIPLFTILEYKNGLKANIEVANIGILNMSDNKAWKNIKFHTLIDFERSDEINLELVNLEKSEIEDMYNVLKGFSLKDFKIILEDFDSFYKVMDKNVLGDKMFTTTNEYYVERILKELKNILNDFQNIIKKIMLDISSEHLNLYTEQHIEYISNLDLNNQLTTEQFNNLTKALDGLGLEYDKNELIYSDNREELILEASYGLKYDVKKLFNRIFRTSDQLINQYRSLADLKNMDIMPSITLIEAGAANRFAFSIFIILVMKDLFNDIRDNDNKPFTEQKYGLHNYQKLIEEKINNFDLDYIEKNILTPDDLQNLLRIKDYCGSITDFINKQNITGINFDGYISHDKFFKLIETNQFGKTIKNIDNKIIDLQKVMSNIEKIPTNGFCKKYYKALMIFNKIIHVLPIIMYNKYKMKKL